MKCIWTKSAVRQREEIYHYLAERNPFAADAMDTRFEQYVLNLLQFPRMGHEGAIPGTLEVLPHRHYRLVYRLTDDNLTIEILALFHTARQWPPV